MNNQRDSQSAQPVIQTTSAQRQKVIFLVLPEVNLLDLAGPAQVFHTANLFGAQYDLEYHANQLDVASAQGLVLGQLQPLSPVSASDLVIVPGLNLEGRTVADEGLDTRLRQWLRDAHVAGAHLASVCTGAFALGDAGLLDGRRCTSHWASVGYLQARYPNAHVLDNVLYVHDDNITTSAGVAAGIDMALALLERAHGPLFTAQVAHSLVVYLRRDSSHPQTSIYLQYRTHLHPNIHRVQDYLIEHATQLVTLRQLGEIAQVSVRSLTRLFKEATGLTPIQYQQRLRLELATNLLHNPALSVEQIAAKCGFEDSRHFRRLWQRHFASSPSMTRLSLSRQPSQPKGSVSS